jgi:hypothetical protein
VNSKRLNAFVLVQNQNSSDQERRKQNEEGRLFVGSDGVRGVHNGFLGG